MSGRVLGRVWQSLREVLPGCGLRDGAGRGPSGAEEAVHPPRELRALQDLRYRGSLPSHHLDAARRGRRTRLHTDVIAGALSYDATPAAARASSRASMSSRWVATSSARADPSSSEGNSLPDSQRTSAPASAAISAPIRPRELMPLCPRAMRSPAHTPGTRGATAIAPPAPWTTS